MGGGLPLVSEQHVVFILTGSALRERKSTGTRHVLGVLHLFADLVAENLVPVDLGAGDGELPAQGFEGRVRHRLVVLADGRLL